MECLGRVHIPKNGYWGGQTSSLLVMASPRCRYRNLNRRTPNNSWGVCRVLLAVLLVGVYSLRRNMPFAKNEQLLSKKPSYTVWANGPSMINIIVIANWLQTCWRVDPPPVSLIVFRCICNIACSTSSQTPGASLFWIARRRKESRTDLT